MNSPELSIILPCRNEEEALGECLLDIQRVLHQSGLHAEIIVSDSSTDRSPKIARQHGATLIKHDKEGYGIAIMEGARHAQGTYILIADADGSYDFADIPAFVDRLRAGADVVMGYRKQSLMKPGAMPWHHKYIGNPLLSFLLRVCTGTKVRDAHCGIRAIRRDVFKRLGLRTTGMEFASEFVLEAHRAHARIDEIPTAYHHRKGISKLRSFRDGWRHLRFILLYSPGYLFFLPGLILFSIGTLLLAWMYVGTVEIAGIRLFLHPLLFASAMIIVGYQLMIFAVFARTYAGTHLGHETVYLARAYKYLTIEKAGLAGALIACIGAGFFAYITVSWIANDFRELSELPNAIVALTLTVIGMQTLFSAFMLSLLGVKKK